MHSILPNSRRHDIAIHASGRIDISARIARALSLAPGDVIDIARDNGEWYLYVKYRADNYTGNHRGRVWATSNGKGTFRTHSASIARAIFFATGTPLTGVLRFPCGTIINRDNQTFITIIYRNPI